MREHSPHLQGPTKAGFSLLQSVGPKRSSNLRPFTKFRLLAHLLPGHLVEFWDRVAAFIAVRWDRKRSKRPHYKPSDWVRSADMLQDVLRADISAVLRETILLETERKVLDQLTKIRIVGPFSMSHNADFDLGRCCYACCRAYKPLVVVETGVAYGVTTRFVLEALAANGEGELWSIDLPPLGFESDAQVGALVPAELRQRWHLYRGPSKRLLPQVLALLPRVDIFIHDSLHTYANMKSEFRAVWPVLRPGGILITDDIGKNTAFQDFAQEARPRFYAVFREQSKDSLFGILVKES